MNPVSEYGIAGIALACPSHPLSRPFPSSQRVWFRLSATQLTIRSGGLSRSAHERLPIDPYSAHVRLGSLSLHR